MAANTGSNVSTAAAIRAAETNISTSNIILNEILNLGNHLNFQHLHTNQRISSQALKLCKQC